MAIVNFKNSPSEETPLTGGASGTLNLMQENGTTHGSDTKLGYSQAFLNDHIVNISNEVDEDYRVNFLHSKNLFDKNTTNIINGAVSTSAVGSLDNNERTIFIKCEPNTTYTISKIASSRFRVATSTTLPTNGTSVSDRQTGQTTDTTLAYTTNASAKYLLLNCWSNNDTSTFSQVLDSIQIEKGSTATSYEPYVVPSIYVDNEEIYSKPVVLWENSSPTSAFAGQEITLNEDISNYKYYEVIVRYLNNQNHLFNTGRIPTTNTTIINCCSTINYRRFVTSVSGNKITFGNGQKVSTYGTGTDDNTYLIPYQVIGYK